MTPAALSAWRARLALSQPDAAKRLAMPLGTYRNYEQGRTAIPGPVAALTVYIEEYGWSQNKEGWLAPWKRGK